MTAVELERKLGACPINAEVKFFGRIEIHWSYIEGEAIPAGGYINVAEDGARTTVVKIPEPLL